MYARHPRKYDDGTPLTKHVITNPIVEVADDGLTGTCRSYYTVFQKAGDAAAAADHQRPLPRRVRAGRRRVALRRRHMGVDHIGDLSLHLLIELRRPTS